MQLPVFRSKRRANTAVTFVLTIGLVDAVIGGVSSHVSLLFLGLGLVSGATALHWTRSPQPKRTPSSRARSPQRLLPERASRPALPPLANPAKRP